MGDAPESMQSGNRAGAEPSRSGSRTQPRRTSAALLAVMASSALFIAALNSATGPGAATVAFALLGAVYLVRWILAVRPAQPAHGVVDASKARPRFLLWPAFALLATLAVGAFEHVAFDAKHAGFVWDSLPTEKVGGTTYAWPGVYVPEFLARDRHEARNWYLTGGPYAPQPDDTAAEAAARVDRYLRERFDIAPDVSELERTFAASRGEGTASPRADGAVVHPYTEGLRAIEEEYADRALRVLFVRSSLDLLLLLVAGCAAIRLGVARAPAWIGSPYLQALVTVVAAALLVWTFFADARATGWPAMLGLYRLHSEHLAVTTSGLCAAAVLLTASAVRRAVEFGAR